MHLVSLLEGQAHLVESNDAAPRGSGPGFASRCRRGRAVGRHPCRKSARPGQSLRKRPQHLHGGNTPPLCQNAPYGPAWWRCTTSRASPGPGPPVFGLKKYGSWQAKRVRPEAARCGQVGAAVWACGQPRTRRASHRLGGCPSTRSGRHVHAEGRLVQGHQPPLGTTVGNPEPEGRPKDGGYPSAGRRG